LTPNRPFPTLSGIASEGGGMADEWEEIRLIEERVVKRRARTREQDQDLQEAAVRPTKDAIPTG
jgi:hypothetical protein